MQLSRKLRFKGKNGSKGMMTGKIYDANVYAENGLLTVQLRTKKCTYRSIREFRHDWDVVE